MTPFINPDQHKFNKADDDDKDLLSGKDTLQITDNDDEDILKNNAAKDETKGKPLSVAELKEDMEDEEDLNEEAETTGVL